MLAMHHFTSLTAITFRTIQGLSTLLDQQQAALDDLVTSFINDVGVIGSLSPEAIANLEVSEHVISGRYAVQLSSVREFVSGLAFWADSIVNEVDPVQRNDLWNDIAVVYVTTCDRVSQLSSLRDADNNASPTFLHCLQCYRMISSSSPLPSLFAGRVDTPTACSIITLSTILTSLPTSTSSFCTPTALSPF